MEPGPSLSWTPTHPKTRAQVVLVLDADDAFRDALAAALRDDGHEVFDYAEFAEVPPLQALARVTALMMDDGHGGLVQLAFADRLHAKYPDVAIIVTTPFITSFLENEIRTRPHVTLMRKPIDYAALCELLAARGGGEVQP